MDVENCRAEGLCITHRCENKVLLVKKAYSHQYKGIILNYAVSSSKQRTQKKKKSVPAISAQRTLFSQNQLTCCVQKIYVNIGSVHVIV